VGEIRRFTWKPQKAEDIYDRHGITFGEIVATIESGAVIEEIDNPNQGEYPATPETAKLTPGEQALESAIGEAIDAGTLKRHVVDHEALARAARNTLRKTERTNIRLTESDLLAIKQRAAREGVPYQTLIASVIHRYVTGEL